MLNVFVVLAGLSQHQSTDSIPTTASSVPLNHTPGVLLTSPSMFQGMLSLLSSLSSC